MSILDESIDTHGFVETGHGFRFRVDPVDHALTVVVRPRVRWQALVFCAVVLGMCGAMVVFIINALGRGYPNGVVVALGWSVLIPIGVGGAVWISVSAVRPGERIRVDGERLRIESRVLGVAKVREHRLDEIANMRAGALAVLPEPSDGSSGPREARQGLAFDLGARYVRFARSLEDEGADELLRVFVGVCPGVVDEHERFRLSALEVPR